VKDTGNPIAPIFASNSSKEAARDSSDQACGLVSKIILSKGAVFRLTLNLWTEAGLTNGAVGVVHSIIYAENTSPPALPVAIIATFQDYIGPSLVPDAPLGTPKLVPICPVKRDWFSNKTHCSRTMLPMILGYALSIHKLQGSTCEKVILNPGLTEFAAGLLLVGATRTKSFKGLTFEPPFPNFSRFEQVNKSAAVRQRLQEEDRLRGLQEKTLEEKKVAIRKCCIEYGRLDELNLIHD
jgi:ATP-dependent exoDNAse (exonuclease V) alpha subunit